MDIAANTRPARQVPTAGAATPSARASRTRNARHPDRPDGSGRQRATRAPRKRAHPTDAPGITRSRAKADMSDAERLAELDGYRATPILSFKPAATPLANGASEIVRRWETDKRYYEARIELDMFDTPILLVANGGKGTRLGMMRVIAAGDQIEDALQAIARRREAHGYRLVS